MTDSSPPTTPDAERIFEVLLRQNAGPLTAFIRSILGASPLVDDVFQETAMVAWRRFDDFDPSKPFGPWLRGIAARTALAACRKAGRERPVGDDLLEALEVRVGRLERMEIEDQGVWARELEDCIRALPGSYRDCIECEARGIGSVREIASAVDLNIEVVKKRLQRGRRHLADCLRRKGILA
ncbi:MAG: sigma-70 family RNA polymerase sigma factor [Phycisphaera sp.]|nr:sigma-70 family RNA polymerase sigma factor [Phycisphaera sp.]